MHEVQRQRRSLIGKYSRLQVNEVQTENQNSKKKRVLPPASPQLLHLGKAQDPIAPCLLPFPHYRLPTTSIIEFDLLFKAHADNQL